MASESPTSGAIPAIRPLFDVARECLSKTTSAQGLETSTVKSCVDEVHKALGTAPDPAASLVAQVHGLAKLLQVSTSQVADAEEAAVHNKAKATARVECERCGQAYAGVGWYRRHMLKVHGEEVEDLPVGTTQTAPRVPPPVGQTEGAEAAAATSGGPGLPTEKYGEKGKSSRVPKAGTDLDKRKHNHTGGSKHRKQYKLEYKVRCIDAFEAAVERGDPRPQQSVAKEEEVHSSMLGRWVSSTPKIRAAYRAMEEGLNSTEAREARRKVRTKCGDLKAGTAKGGSLGRSKRGAKRQYPAQTSSNFEL